MINAYRSLLLLFAGSARRELARQLLFAKVENDILRAKLPAKITISRHERQRLLKFGTPLGKNLRKLISIVHPDTFLRWQREHKRAGRPVKIHKRGRRRSPEQVRKLVVKLAKENGWGYTRLLGELKKLGVQSISRSTVKNILRENGLDPGPKRGAGTWDEFIRRHAETLWQCDLISKRALTARGIKELFVVVFLHVGTRRVFLSPATARPDEVWMQQQVSAFVSHAAAGGLPARQLLHDRDSKFSAAVDADLRSSGIKVHRLPPRSPNLLAYAERFNLSIKSECLDHFIVFGEKHLNYLVAEWLAHYHEERPHQGKDNELLIPVSAAEANRAGQRDVLRLGDVRCRQRLGGLLKHYHRRAA
jgi:putative transposase